MARRTESYEAKDKDGVTIATIESEALPFEKSEDLLPDILDIVSTALSRAAGMIASGQVAGVDDVMALLPGLGGMISKLQGGKLKQLAPQILAGTTVVMAMPGSSEKLKYDLCKKEDRVAVFEARPELYFPVLFHAGRVTFGPFLPAVGRGKKAAASQKAT